MALTSTNNLTQDIQQALSAELLLQVDDEYMWYNSGPITHADADAQVPGTNIINFNRPTLPTGTFTEASRRLTDGTVIPATSLAIAMTQVALTTREYAGPHDGAAINPFGVTEFFKNRAKHNAVALIGEFLRRDRNRFLDQTILDLLMAATVVVTPDGTAAGAIAQGVPFSVEMLRRWNKTMKDALIPTYPNGRWRMFLSTKDELDMKRDADYKEACRYLGQQNPLFFGHVASMEGFDIGINTRLSTTAVGGGGAITGYQSAAWGPYGIGHGLALAPSVRRADDTDFGRQERVIWKSEEALGTLYADLITRGLST